MPAWNRKCKGSVKADERREQMEMTLLDKITEKVLKQIDSSSGFKQEGAYNLRENGVSLCHGIQNTLRSKGKRINLE